MHTDAKELSGRQVARCFNLLLQDFLQNGLTLEQPSKTRQQEA